MQVPHVFSPGFPARSGEVNENFQALADAITALEAKVASLETATTAPPVAGTYTLLGFQTGLISGGNQSIVEGIVYKGSVTLAPDKTLSLSINEFKNELRIGGANPGVSSYGLPTESQAGTWSFENGTLTLAVERNLRFGRGAPRLFVGNHHNPNDGSCVMLFLMRNGA
jgi:hypothetical protein